MQHDICDVGWLFAWQAGGAIYCETSTVALTNVTLPYVLKLANMGWRSACKLDKSLSMGLNIVEGEVVYKEIAETFHLEEPVLV